jgi:hypothetical protein
MAYGKGCRSTHSRGRGQVAQPSYTSTSQTFSARPEFARSSAQLSKSAAQLRSALRTGSTVDRIHTCSCTGACIVHMLQQSSQNDTTCVPDCTPPSHRINLAQVSRTSGALATLLEDKQVTEDLIVILLRNVTVNHCAIIWFSCSLRL